MANRRWRGIGSALLATSLLLLMMSIGGTWGTVYGQTGGATPTPVLTVVSPGGGAEGDEPARPEAVAGESGEAGDTSARPEVVAGESAEAGDTTSSNLPQSGAESAVQWPLLVAGIVMFLSGAFIFRRTRKLQA